MELIKKHLVKILCAAALIALFFPMATLRIESNYGNYAEEISVSGFTVAFQGYLAMLLILGPVALIAADFVEALEPHRHLLAVGAPALCILVTVIAYFQASGIAAASSNAYVETTSSLGFGGILCLLCHIAIGILGYLEHKEPLKKMLGK